MLIVTFQTVNNPPRLFLCALLNFDLNWSLPNTPPLCYTHGAFFASIMIPVGPDKSRDLSRDVFNYTRLRKILYHFARPFFLSRFSSFSLHACRTKKKGRGARCLETLWTFIEWFKRRARNCPCYFSVERYLKLSSLSLIQQGNHHQRKLGSAGELRDQPVSLTRKMESFQRPVAQNASLLGPIVRQRDITTAIKSFSLLSRPSIKFQLQEKEKSCKFHARIAPY